MVRIRTYFTRYSSYNGQNRLNISLQGEQEHFGDNSVKQIDLTYPLPMKIIETY